MIEKLLAEREATHGDYRLSSRMVRGIQSAMSERPMDLSPEQALALEMIAVKISRICCGDPTFTDHWNDIAGWATLAARSCTD